MQVSLNQIKFQGLPTDNKQKKSPIHSALTDESFAEPKWRSGFITGATLGTLVAMGIVSQYNDVQTKRLLDDMKIVVNNENSDSIELNDINDDNTPEIILKDKDGNKDIYNIKNHMIYTEIDGELIRKDF